jgi:HemY protein
VLMAKLERTERNDEGRAREWMARALNAPPDPQWTADGYVSDRWLPVSPVSGRIDAFVWRVPLSGAIAAPIIEPELPTPTSAAPAPRGQNAAIPAVASAVRSAPEPVKAEPVIPLVHAPDDPGPDGAQESGIPADQASDGWRKIFQ